MISRDGWYESEEPTRHAMVSELQRIRRRTVVRPIPVIALALLITGAITYKVATKPRMYTSDVVLAVAEGSLTKSGDTTIPFDQLKAYVASVLLPDADLRKLIERRQPGRIDKVGAPFALQALRDRIAVAIWKNSFIYYHEVDANAQKSARIGIEVTDEDPDDAHDIAQELASIVIRTHDAQRQKLTKGLVDEVAMVRRALEQRSSAIELESSMKHAALVTARREGKHQLAAMLAVDVAALAHEHKRVDDQLTTIAASPEAVADRATAAHLDTTITVVDSVKQERHEQSGFVLAMIIAVIGVGAVVGSALVLGAFDARVHETDDVSRLGLPILGHLPGFAGDHVGSLEARGAARARVPSFLRWRSHR